MTDDHDQTDLAPGRHRGRWDGPAPAPDHPPAWSVPAEASTDREGAAVAAGVAVRFWSIFVAGGAVVRGVLALESRLLRHAARDRPSPVQQFITVPPDKGHPVAHPVLMTDVRVGRVTALSYLFYKLQGDTALEQVDAVTGGTAPSQLDRPGQPGDVPGRGRRQGGRPRATWATP